MPHFETNLGQPALGLGSRERSRGFFSASIAVACGFALLYLIGILSIVDDLALLPLVAGLALGALVADGVTGFVHWTFDTWGSEQTPWLGESLIRGFREHHRDPRAMLHHDWNELNGEPALAAAVGFVVFAPIALQLAFANHVFACFGLWSLICTAALGNQLHQWAHADRPPGLVRRLQRFGVILAPSSHAQHHQAPFTTHYCIATGWLNGILDAITFWRILERCVERAAGASARRRLEKT